MADESALEQIGRLARFIIEEVPGEPSRSEGAVDAAIRLIRASLARWVEIPGVTQADVDAFMRDHG